MQRRRTILAREYIRPHASRSADGEVTYVRGHYETKKELDYGQCGKKMVLVRQIAGIGSALSMPISDEQRSMLAQKLVDKKKELKNFIEQNPVCKHTIASPLIFEREDKNG